MWDEQNRLESKEAGSSWGSASWRILTDLRCVVSEPVYASLKSSKMMRLPSPPRAESTMDGEEYASLVHPGGVEGVGDEEERHNQNHPTRHLQTNQSPTSLSEPMI